MPLPLIIGVHGLANKPPKQELREGWEAAIREGLGSIGETNPVFDFEMVYWAERMYTQTMHRNPHFRADVLYNSQSYAPAEQTPRAYKDSLRDLIKAWGKEAGGSVLSKIGLEDLAERIIKEKLKDLDFYYNDRPIAGRDDPAQTAGCRDELQAEVAGPLREAVEAGRRVLLISHSMGAIISYDTLRKLGPWGGRNADPLPASVRWVTIGAPLGLFYVKQNIDEDYDYSDVRTPSIVTGWTNFADKRDRVATDTHLADDYGPNSAGVRVRDDLVNNEYTYTALDNEKKSNPHKSYGYLRCPEVAKTISAFLKDGAASR